MVHFVSLKFTGTSGLLEKWQEKGGRDVKCSVEFVHYGAAMGRERSGAYLFMPDGPAKTFKRGDVSYIVERGPIVSAVTAKIGDVVFHKMSLVHGETPEARGPEIRNIVNVQGNSNFELAMRVTTEVQNKDEEFFSDLNGFQLLRRQRMSKVPLQANYYPLPSQAGLEDGETRFTVLTSESHGGASLQQGSIEVMLDRVLDQDDNRGLGQGVQDNKLTPSSFRILMERVGSTGDRLSLHEQPAAFASALAHRLSLDLQHPLFVMHSYSTLDYTPSYSALAQALPCDMHLMNLRTVQDYSRGDDSKTPTSKAALIFHRLGTDCRFSTNPLSCPNEVAPSLASLFNGVKVSGATEASLTMLKKGGITDLSKAIDVPPMELQTYIVDLE